MSSDFENDPRRYAPAVARNRDVVRDTLIPRMPEKGVLLEIASGSGEHAAHIAPSLPDGLDWQPSDLDPDALAGIDAHARESGCARIWPAIALDVAQKNWWIGLEASAIFCANMIHIAPWMAGRGLLRGAGKLLPAGGALMLYGPFKRDGTHTAPSNAEFDAWLKERDSSWGVRDLESDVLPIAREAGLNFAEAVAMPANNFLMVLKRP